MSLLLPASNLLRPLGSSVVELVVTASDSSSSTAAGASVATGSSGVSLDVASVAAVVFLLANNGLILLTWTCALAAGFGRATTFILWRLFRRFNGFVSWTGAASEVCKKGNTKYSSVDWRDVRFLTTVLQVLESDSNRWFWCFTNYLISLKLQDVIEHASLKFLTLYNSSTIHYRI